MIGVSRRLFRVLLSLTALMSVIVTTLLMAAPARAQEMSEPAKPVAVNAEEAEMQASALAAEDRRLVEIRTVTSLARWQGNNWKVPYRLGTASGYTLVLTPKSAPYSIDDLLRLAPQTFRRMSDGSFVLSEHVVVTPAATLRLSSPGGLTLRLASDHDGFSTIVSFGGKIEIVGEKTAPVKITSWDIDAGAIDELTTDGRAYIRAIGGQFEAQHLVASDLGFWSGRTGGIALTGTDRPNTGAIESVDDDPATSGASQSLLNGVTWQPAGSMLSGQEPSDFDYTVPAVDYVSSRLTNVTVERNAFGLFVSSANGLQVSDSAFKDNPLGGVVLHRYVTNAVINRTSAVHNGGDGFTLDRATSGITISESTASSNAESGFNLAGRPLAEGPSAVGASLRSYGNNSVSNSTATNNGRYGIQIVGGFNVGASNNVVERHDMGIMVHGPATRISITGNTVRNARRHGVALVNGVTESTVTGNVVEDASTGVYLRDSSGQIKGNTITGAGSHGVSLVGKVGGSEVSFNVLAGSGASALDANRSKGSVSSSMNNTTGWNDTTPWYFWFKKLLQPMTALWSVLAILLVLSAIRGRRSRPISEHPYAHQMAHAGVLPVPRPGVLDLRDNGSMVLE